MNDIKYVMTVTEDGDENADCSCCGMCAPLHDFGSSGLLCEFCSTTKTSQYVRYRTRDEFTLLRAEIWLAAACAYNLNRP